MKKIILLALATLMMVGCNTEPHYGTVYIGNNWEIFFINDSIYLMIPKYKEYHTPYILNVKDNATADSARNAGKRK